MAAIQFETGNVTLQAECDSWGPFLYDLEDAIPSDRTVESAVVKTYLGRVKPKDSDVLDSFTESTSEIIDSNSMSTDYKVAVYFNRPTTLAYINQKHSMVITFTLDAAGGGGTHTAFFYAIEVL